MRRGSNKEFVNLQTIAKGSCGEVRSQLYVVLDQNYIDQQVFDDLLQIATRVSVMLQAFISTLRNSDLKGPRYK